MNISKLNEEAVREILKLFLMVTSYKRWLSEAEDRLANSWEKRTVEEIDEFMHQFSGYGSSDSEVATALVKFLEEKRI